MRANQAPTKFGTPWGSVAVSPDINFPIPVPSQIGVQAGLASFTDGFPPLCFTPTGAGGVAPFGADFNGIMKMLTLSLQWQQTGAYYPWDSGFSAAIGGYPTGAIVATNNANTPGTLFLSLVDGNTDNPDLTSATTGAYLSANWQPFSVTGATTGDVKPTLKSVADPGWLLLNDQTVGNPTSGATFASNQAFMLFCLLWPINSTYAPMFTSAGAPIARGANAVTDWNNNRRMQLATIAGRAICAAGSGAGLSVRALGQFLGEENHTLSIGEIPSHNHPGSVVSDTRNWGVNINGGAGGTPIILANFSTGNPLNFAVSVTSGSLSLTIAAQGGGGSHNNMQPSAFLGVEVKL